MHSGSGGIWEKLHSMVEGFLLSALAMIRWIRNIAVRLRSFHHKLFPVYVWTYVNTLDKKS